MVVLNIRIPQIEILKQCNIIWVKGRLFLLHQTSCLPLTHKKIIIVYLVQIHAALEYVEKVLDTYISNLGVIDGIWKNNPARATYILQKVQGGRWKLNLKYVYDM